MTNNKQNIKDKPELKQGYKKTKFGWIPEDWEIISLKNVSEKVTDGEHLTPKRTKEGFFLLSARNIRDGFISTDNVDFVPKEEYIRIRKRCNPETGDVLISCSGTIGRVAVVPTNFKAVMVRSAALIKPNYNVINNEYLKLS